MLKYASSMMRLWAIFPIMAGLVLGQTVEEGREELKAQEEDLGASFDEYMRHQAEIFSEKTKDEDGNRTVAYTARLEKTHEAWLAWAELQARDLVAAEPVGRQEVLFLMAKAWLFEKKSREFKDEIGGPENSNQPVIDDSRINVGPVNMAFTPYLGEVGGSKGAFALQWVDEKSVRGGFASHNGLKSYRVFGDNSKEGVIECLFIESGADEGIEVKVKKSRENGLVLWSGHSELLGDIFIRKIAIPAEAEGVRHSSYEGKSGRSQLAVTLGWKSSGHVSGGWADLGSGIPSDMTGFNYEEGRLFLNRWKDGGPSEKGASPWAMWFLSKTGTNPVTWKGKAIYLNGYEEEVELTK